MKVFPASLVVSVLARDIKAGKNTGTFSPTLDPVARATNRALRQAGFQNNWTSVGGRLRIYTRRAGNLAATYVLPSTAERWVMRFDVNIEPLDPFTFVAVKEA